MKTYVLFALTLCTVLFWSLGRAEAGRTLARDPSGPCAMGAGAALARRNDAANGRTAARPRLANRPATPTA